MKKKIINDACISCYPDIGNWQKDTMGRHYIKQRNKVETFGNLILPLITFIISFFIYSWVRCQIASFVLDIPLLLYVVLPEDSYYRRQIRERVTTVQYLIRAVVQFTRCLSSLAVLFTSSRQGSV